MVKDTVLFLMLLQRLGVRATSTKEGTVLSHQQEGHEFASGHLTLESQDSFVFGEEVGERQKGDISRR